MIQEEAEALQSLFCRPGECFVQDNEVIINTHIETHTNLEHDTGSKDHGLPVKIVLQLGTDYPQSIPQISIFSEHLSRDAVSKVKSEVIESCADLIGEPMLISSIFTIQEAFSPEIKAMSASEDSVDKKTIKDHVTQINDKVWTNVLHIDHMRSKSKYCKTLEKWAAGLSLNGRIMFCNNLILVLLQGDIENIKEFVVRLKTVNIDVDSKGHSCKERMMTVVCEQQHHVSDITRFTTFERVELESRSQLEDVFHTAGLQSIYKEHVVRLK